MIPSVPPAIGQAIQTQTGSVITGFSFSSGGCVNHGGKLLTSGGTYFLKWNDRHKFPSMFDAEAKGLSLLRTSSSLAVPDVVYSGNADGYQFLLLEHITPGVRRPDYWREFGSGLASLHKTTAPAFGLDHDNYIGSLVQKNDLSSSWVRFFIEQRLQVQVKLGRDQNKLDTRVSKKFDMLFNKLPDLLPEEPASLLHGDLWGGNIMTTSRGAPCLIDPAVYYGHREMDLAMTHLFGGFDPSFLDHYDQVYPLVPGYTERFDVYNLYPLLVHVNLFGGGYVSQLVSILDQTV